MAISFSCDQCRKRYEVDDSLAGKRIKCKGCGATLSIPGPRSAPPGTRPAGASRPPSAPRRPKAPADNPIDLFGLEDESPASGADAGEVLLPRAGAGRRSGSDAGGSSAGVPSWVWLVGGGVGLLLIVLLIAALFSGSPGRPPVARNAPPQGGRDEAATQDGEGASVPDAAAGRFRRDETSAAAPRTAWHIQADPAPETPQFPAQATLAIPVPEAFSSDDVVYPSTPSAFVILGGNENADHSREVWDLRTATRVGRLSGHIEVARPMALSPDGLYFVCHTNPVPRTTDIWRIADAQRIGRIEDADRIPDVIDFAGPGPGRVVIGTSYGKALQVWDVAAGKPVVEFQTPSGFDRDSVALSPGRRYLALTLAQKNRLQVYDLTNGRMAGELEMPREGSSDLDCQGMAFSSDGTALAGLFSAAGTTTHLMSWDATTGTLASDFRTEGNDPYGRSSEGQSLQWIPDGSGWLIANQAIVERRSGQVVWSMPFDPVRPQDRGPRKLLDAGRMVAVGRVRNQKTLQFVPLPGDKIQAAMTLARGGGSAVDAILPATTTADRGAAKPVAAPSSPVRWAATPDPTPAPKAAAARSIALRVEALDVLGLLVSGPEASQAIVVSSPKGRLTTNQGQQSQQPRQVDRYDLADGRPLGRFEIASVSRPIAVSPDATHLLLAHAGAADRLDVHATADGKHVVGWRPYEKETGDDRNVAWADFLDAGRVLTVNPAGTLILWSLPDCKAVYIAEGAMQGAPILSPGRKTLAALRGGTLRLLDPATGTALGDATASGHQAEAGLKAAAFDPEGQELAAVLDGTLVRWDLKTGQVVEEVPSPAPKAGSLRYGTARHVLIDGKVLYDLGRKRTVWSYEGGVHATGGPAGRHWYASGAISGPATLVAIAIPEEKIARAEATADDPKTPAMLREGTTVSLQVDGSPPRDPETFRRTLLEGLTARLRAVGAEVAEDRPVRLVVRFRERDTGHTIEYRKLGGGPNNAETRTIPDREIDWELSVTDGRGNPVVIAGETVVNLGIGLQRLPAGENDWEGFLRTEQWQAAAARVAARDLPFFVARGPHGPTLLPGTSSLGYPRQ
jgi:WD40 repeat protein